MVAIAIKQTQDSIEQEKQTNKDNIIHLEIKQLHEIPIASCMRAFDKDWSWEGVF